MPAAERLSKGYETVAARTRSPARRRPPAALSLRRQRRRSRSCAKPGWSWRGRSNLGRTRSRRPISASTPALDVICRAGEVPVRLRVWPTRLAGLLRAVTLPSHAAAADAPLCASSVEVHRQGRSYLLHVDGEHLLATNDLMVARSETLRRLVLASQPRREWLAVLHGAGVAGPAGAALLCGFSGAGKSTLTGLLVASGLELVTDDYAPIEAGTRLLWPVPFGLSVKEGSWPLLAPHFPALADAPLIRSRARRQRYLANLRRATRPQPVRLPDLPTIPAGSATRADGAATRRGAGTERAERRLVRELEGAAGRVRRLDRRHAGLCAELW